MKMKSMILASFLLLAGLPIFAAYESYLKIDGVEGESTDASHRGWIEASSFSWGVTHATHVPAGATTAARCSIHEFTIQKRIDKSSPKLATMALQGNIPSMTIDVGGERHLLKDVAIKSVQQLPAMGDGSVRQAVTFTFQRCATHETQSQGGPINYNKTDNYGKVFPKVESNAMFSFGGGPQGAIILQDLHFIGSNQAIIAVREAANGMLLPYIERASQSKRPLSQFTVSGYQSGGTAGADHKGQLMTFTFHDVVISSVSPGSGFKQITLNFGKFDGPMAGFHDISIN